MQWACIRKTEWRLSQTPPRKIWSQAGPGRGSSSGDEKPDYLHLSGVQATWLTTSLENRLRSPFGPYNSLHLMWGKIHTKKEVTPQPSSYCRIHYGQNHLFLLVGCEAVMGEESRSLNPITQRLNNNNASHSLGFLWCFGAAAAVDSQFNLQLLPCAEITCLTRCWKPLKTPLVISYFKKKASTQSLLRNRMSELEKS